MATPGQFVRNQFLAPRLATAKVILLAVVLLPGCKRTVAPNTPERFAPRVNDTSLDAGDSATHASPPAWFAEYRLQPQFGVRTSGERDYFFPAVTGGGAALFDYDDDGRLDLYLLNNAGPGSTHVNRLFRQQESGAFHDVTEGSGLGVAGYGQGVAVADANNDGRLDVCLFEFGATRLFVQSAVGRFIEQTQCGIDNAHWSVSGCFFDYDRDGWLDLAVANYVEYDSKKTCAHRSGQRDFCGPDSMPPASLRLYRNITGERHGEDPVSEDERGQPRFIDVSLDSGVAQFRAPGLGVTCADVTEDGWPDILVANDGQPNWLFVNQRNGAFREEAELRGLAVNALGQAEANMGIAFGDVDGDGLDDCFITHLREESHRLWRQVEVGFFQDATAEANLHGGGARSTGFGTVLADFDLDGDLDLAIANGLVKRADGVAADADDFWSVYRERNMLFANQGRGRFLNVSSANAPFCSDAGVYRGLCCGDIDNDGMVDLVVTRIDGPTRILLNVAPRNGHWLMVRAVDRDLRRDAYGAEVIVVSGGATWRRLIQPGSSYACSSEPRAHFGLGDHDIIDRIEVRWPDGEREAFHDVSLDRQVTLERGAGRPQPD